MRTFAQIAILAAIAVAACSPETPSRPPVTEVISPTPSPVTPLTWIRSDMDAQPSPAVLEAIASHLGVPPSTILAAALAFDHPGGSKASIWVFQAADVLGSAGIARWIRAEKRCADDPESITIAGLRTTKVRRQVDEQCQPEYLVAIDQMTVAVILDDGGYKGSDPAMPTPVGYRGLNEVTELVVWLRRNLPDIPLTAGGPSA